MKQFLTIDSSYPIDKLLPFCNCSINDNRPGAQNMSPVGWEDNGASFLYLLYIEKRYDGAGNGYIIYIEDDEILCGGGFSESNIDAHMTHLSSRSYTVPGLLLPRIHGKIHDLAIDISIEVGRYGAFDSANEYNKHFAEKYTAVNDPKNHPGYFMQDGKHYAKPGVRIHPMTPAGPLYLKGTKQWITYMIWNEAHRESFLQTLETIKWIE
jgi:hypothetical protein